MLQIIKIICVTYDVQKIFLFELYIKQLLKNIDFSRNAPKFHIITKIVI